MMLGVDPGTVSRWETNETKPSRPAAHRLNELFRIDNV
jgi:DNA-binding transcriptional regulator YiaG